jgi:hypothetical protein
MKKTGLPLFIFLVILLALSCKSKKKALPENQKITSVLSFIKSQVAHVDTSLYSIRKVTYVDSTKTDTVYYKREEFRQLAADFLLLPDVAGSKYEGRFTEQQTYDETIDRVIITCMPVNPEKEEIQKQELLIRPNPSGDKITSIIIDYFINNKDSSVQKKMLWQVDKSFQVTTTRQLPGQQETNSTYKVIWNEEDDE